jgi:tetratricopeptide (TPR) repeat protein
VALERTIALQHAIAAESRWAPRDVQEARLRQIDALLACRALEGDSIDLAIERAVLLGALNRLEEAKLAFISILKQFPTHFSALNEFGTLLARTGAIAAACRVYSEAIIHHANNPIAHVNLQSAASCDAIPGGASPL